MCADVRVTCFCVYSVLSLNEWPLQGHLERLGSSEASVTRTDLLSITTKIAFSFLSYFKTKSFDAHTHTRCFDGARHREVRWDFALPLKRSVKGLWRWHTGLTFLITPRVCVWGWTGWHLSTRGRFQMAPWYPPAHIQVCARRQQQQQPQQEWNLSILAEKRSITRASAACCSLSSILQNNKASAKSTRVGKKARKTSPAADWPRFKLLFPK